MAGTRLLNSSYGITNNNRDEVDSKNILKIGCLNISFDSTPRIEANSVVDVDGVLYIFKSLENINGNPNNGDVYVKIVTSGATCTAQWTNEALPDYDYLRKGYYNTSGHRFIALFDLASSVYTFHYFLDITTESVNQMILDFEDRNSDFWSFI